MSDENTTVNETGENNDIQAPDELTMLKQRASQMGIKFSPKIGVDSLRDKVNAAIKGEAEPKEEVSDDSNEPVISETQRKANLRQKMQKEQMKLVRVRITNMNPHKKNLAGEIFTVASKYLGIVKKFVPYGEATEDGYHIPYVMLNQLKARKFLSIKTRRDRTNGNIIVDQRWAPEFAIEELEPLTPNELKELASSQAAKGGYAE